MSARAGTPSRVAEPERAQAVDRVEQELLLLLRRARSHFERLAGEVHPGLDAAAYGILRLIDTGAAATVTELASRLSVGKPTVSRQVIALESLGLLHREPAAADRRAMELRLTPEGLARLTATRNRSKAQLRSLLGEWSEDDVNELGELLGRFNRLS